MTIESNRTGARQRWLRTRPCLGPADRESAGRISQLTVPKGKAVPLQDRVTTRPLRFPYSPGQTLAGATTEIGICGSPTRTRTGDLRISSRILAASTRRQGPPSTTNAPQAMPFLAHASSRVGRFAPASRSRCKGNRGPGDRFHGNCRKLATRSLRACDCAVLHRCGGQEDRLDDAASLLPIEAARGYDCAAGLLAAFTCATGDRPVPARAGRSRAGRYHPWTK